jgi:5-methylcytosine-specific restriction endonuclease McrA
MAKQNMENKPTLLSAPVLVLNANFEPLNVCTIRRALGLIHTDKATLVSNGRGYIKTVSRLFQAPSIVRLSYMVKRPRPTVKLTKAEVFRRDNYTCQYCGKRTSKLTVDHVIPRSLGGSYTWDNLVAACPVCNHKKGGKTTAQANMPLLSKPFTPRPSAEYLFGRYLKSNQEWLPFVEGW